ncbi:MAG TPA: NF038122 family metalloprotease [Candidatus Acidoferrales bacterium]|nr:NF038122 family metalloprotease [Candidatus Acidoferrales bacterium]
MKKLFISLLCVAAAFGTALTADGVTIVPTWDSSITSDPNVSEITNGIMFAIQTLESNLTDNLTVQILFVENPDVGLGESSTWNVTVNYSDYLAALQAGATSLNDSNALSQLPNSLIDPVLGESQIQITLPLARLMAFFNGYGPDGYDATINLNIPIMNLTRPPADPDAYDLISTTEHEMDEVLGFDSTLPGNYPGGPIGPMDLFRYMTNSTGLTRTWTTSGDNAYFSVDGTNLWARFNQNPGGDFHDWWSNTGLWAPPGVTPYPQVQDAYAYPDTAPDLGSNELAGLDVIGYTLAVPPLPPPVLTIVAGSGKTLILSWPANDTGFTLQESTSLLSGSWADSATGSTNPATIVPATPAKFYRLYENTPSSAVTKESLATKRVLQNPSLQLATHIYRPMSN